MMRALTIVVSALAAALIAFASISLLRHNDGRTTSMTTALLRRRLLGGPGYDDPKTVELRTLSDEYLSSLPLPTPLSEPPSKAKPFFFFHLRKSGGSAFRPAIAAAALRLQLAFLVACLEDVGGGTNNLVNMLVGNDKARSCNLYTLDFLPGISKSKDPKFEKANELSVVAAHLYYDSIPFLLSIAFEKNSHATIEHRGYNFNYMDHQPFSCIIMVRDPIDQFLSCYQERLEPAIGRKASELPLETLENVLTGYTEMSNPHGCTNEIARFISPSYLNDEQVNRGQLSREAIQETKRRISQCTITDVTQRHDDTLRIVQHWHPWLAEDYLGQNTGHHAHIPNASVRKELTPEALELIAQHTSLDRELYDFAMLRFEQEVEAINMNTNMNDANGIA